jgi:hypothetical protein
MSRSTAKPRRVRTVYRFRTQQSTRGSSAGPTFRSPRFPCCAVPAAPLPLLVPPPFILYPLPRTYLSNHLGPLRIGGVQRPRLEAGVLVDAPARARSTTCRGWLVIIVRYGDLPNNCIRRRMSTCTWRRWSFGVAGLRVQPSSSLSTKSSTQPAVRPSNLQHMVVCIRGTVPRFTDGRGSQAHCFHGSPVTSTRSSERCQSARAHQIHDLTTTSVIPCGTELASFAALGARHRRQGFFPHPSNFALRYQLCATIAFTSSSCWTQMASGEYGRNFDVK